MTNWYATNVAPAIDADMAWSAELTRVYGKRAGDARYDARGRATDELARLGTIRDELCETMRQAFAATRKPYADSLMAAVSPAHHSCYTPSECHGCDCGGES